MAVRIVVVLALLVAFAYGFAKLVDAASAISPRRVSNCRNWVAQIRTNRLLLAQMLLSYRFPVLVKSRRPLDWSHDEPNGDEKEWAIPA
ncbi:hypothetical protein CK216_26960 [Mesorhizobium sp. WSM3876]|nr:hypothetical protein CK216_26960 [Mesorhizobium sp. WSM3876]